VDRVLVGHVLRRARAADQTASGFGCAPCDRGELEGGHRRRLSRCRLRPVPMPEVHRAQGTRDFLPAQMASRLRLVERLRKVFVTYGFEPLETPAMERIETLLGKYGDEGDKLVFKILRRGEREATGEADLALRYDLTVPLARVIAMHPELPMPFKRHQIQPVWRADRPQKGRFREFWQCDVDTVGSTSPIADAECLAVLHDSLVALGFEHFQILVNHRAILRGMAA